MVVGPRTEASLFENRDKFDLVAVYDQSSKTFGDASSPLSVLIRIISETAFKKILKRMPMMLIGGLDAWKQEFGSSEIIRGEVEMSKPFSPPTSPNPNNPFTNGKLNSMLIGGYASGNGTIEPHQIWNPVGRNGPSPAHNGILEHRPVNSLDISGHSRWVVVSLSLSKMFDGEFHSLQNPR